MTDPVLCDELTINASAFKARCLELMDCVDSGVLWRVTVTKRGKPVAVLIAPPAAQPRPELFSNMGSFSVSPPLPRDPSLWYTDEEKAAHALMTLDEYLEAS